MRDMSFDLTLRNDSVNTSKKSVFRNLVDTVSRSIDKLTAPKKIDFEKKRIDFSQFLTDHALATYSQLFTEENEKFGFYSSEDENLILNRKNELLKFSSYLKYLQNQRKEDICRNKSLYDYCMKNKLNLQSDLNNYKEILDYVKVSKKINARHKKVIDIKCEAINRAKFEKIKTVENRGRILANIKNVECMLNEVSAQNLELSIEKRDKLLFYRQELIKILREKIKLEDSIALKNRIYSNNKQIEFLKESLDKIQGS